MSALRGRAILVAVAALVAEVLLLRIALRLGPVLPAQASVTPLFAGVEWLGVVALNVAVLAGCLLIGLAALAAVRAGPGGALLAFALVGAIVVGLGLPTLVDVLPDGMAGIVHGTVFGTAILLTVLGAAQPVRLRAVLALAGLAQILALAQAVTQAVGPLGGADTLGGRPSVLAETVAVAAALALPWLCRVRPRRGELALGLAAGLPVAVAGAAQPWGLATVAIWTMAFTLFLPSILYGAALASVVVTVLALWRVPGGRELAAGLVLIWLAGLKLDVSAFALVALAGLTVASRAAYTVPVASAAGETIFPWRPAGQLSRSLR